MQDGPNKTSLPPLFQAVLREIRKKDIADPFLTPVDWKALNIPDYPTIIKRPMDLGTVGSQARGTTSAVPIY